MIAESGDVEQPTLAQEAAWKSLLADLPQGREPFVVEPQRLALLDAHSRNSILQEQNFRMLKAGYGQPARDALGRPVYMPGADGQMRPVVVRMKVACLVHTHTRCTECDKAVEITVRRGLPTEKTVKICQNCNGTGQVLYNPEPRMCCRHATAQDPIKPVGLVFTPKGYWVCKDCWKLIERRKFDFQKDIIGVCLDCVRAEAHRIEQIDPTKVVRML